jgi:hypothetical protein
VYLDGNYKGKTLSSEYLDISDLHPGTYTVRLTYTGYYDYSSDITVSRNEVVSLYAVMTPEVEEKTVSAGGILALQSDPSGADIFLDNEYKGVTPLSLQIVSTGEHHLLIRKGGYSVYSSTVTIVSDQTTAISAILTPEYQAPQTAEPPAPVSTPVPEPTRAALPFWIPVVGLFMVTLCFARKIW